MDGAEWSNSLPLTSDERSDEPASEESGRARARKAAGQTDFQFDQVEGEVAAVPATPAQTEPEAAPSPATPAAPTPSEPPPSERARRARGRPALNADWWPDAAEIQLAERGLALWAGANGDAPPPPLNIGAEVRKFLVKNRERGTTWESYCVCIETFGPAGAGARRPAEGWEDIGTAGPIIEGEAEAGPILSDEPQTPERHPPVIDIPTTALAVVGIETAAPGWDEPASVRELAQQCAAAQVWLRRPAGFWRQWCAALAGYPAAVVRHTMGRVRAEVPWLGKVSIADFTMRAEEIMDDIRIALEWEADRPQREAREADRRRWAAEDAARAKAAADTVQRRQDDARQEREAEINRLLGRNVSIPELRPIAELMARIWPTYGRQPAYGKGLEETQARNALLIARRDPGEALAWVAAVERHNQDTREDMPDMPAVARGGWPASLPADVAYPPRLFAAICAERAQAVAARTRPATAEAVS